MEAGGLAWLVTTEGRAFTVGADGLRAAGGPQADGALWQPDGGVRVATSLRTGGELGGAWRQDGRPLWTSPGVSWADGLGNWEDGYNSGAFRKAADAGLVDMSTITEIWRSKMIPEGPLVVRRELPQDVKDKIYAMMDTMWADDPECAYNVAAGEAKDFVPVSHDEYLGIVAARKLQEGM